MAKNIKQKQYSKVKTNKIQKVIAILSIVFITIAMPLKTFATEDNGFAVSEDAITLSTGETKSIEITKTYGVGKLDIVSSNAEIATVDQSSIFLDEPISINITAVTVGSATITITSTNNFANFDTEEILEGQTTTIDVTVKNASTNPDTPAEGDGNNEEEESKESDNKDNEDGENNNNEEDEDLVVPNTSGTTKSDTSAPDTGENTNNNKGIVEILTYIMPISIAILTSIIFIHKRNQGHKKFDY